MIRLKAIERPLLPPPLLPASDGNRNACGSSEILRESKCSSNSGWIATVICWPVFPALNVMSRFCKSTLPLRRLQTSFNLAPVKYPVRIAPRQSRLAADISFEISSGQRYLFLCGSILTEGDWPKGSCRADQASRPRQMAMRGSSAQAGLPSGVSSLRLAIDSGIRENL